MNSVVRFAMEDPKPKSLLPPVRLGPLPDALLGCLLRKRLPVSRKGLHHLGIGVQAVEILEKCGRHDCLSEKAGGGEDSDGVGHGAAYLLAGRRFW